MVLWDCNHHGFMGFVETLALLKANHPGNNNLLMEPFILSALSFSLLSGFARISFDIIDNQLNYRQLEKSPI